MTVSVGDGVSVTLVQPSIYRGPVTPTSSNVRIGDLWEDTSVSPPVLRQCSAISPVTWVAVASGGGGGDGYNLLVVNGGAATLSTTLTLSNANNVSFGLAGGVITATATFAGGGGGGGIAVAAGTQTATTNTVVFANSNGLTFGMSGSTQITGSYTVPSTAGLISNINVSAGTTSNNLSAVTFSNSNGLSFGLNGSVVTGSYTVPTQTAFVLSNSNNVSFGTNGSTVTATASFNQSVQTQNSVQVQGSSGAISFANSNGITFGGNASTITASHNGITSQTVQPGIQSIAFANTTFTTGGVSFSNANGISFGSSGAQVTASYTVPTQTQFVFSNSNNVSFGTNGSTVTATVTVPAQTNQTIGLYAVSNTTGASSSSTFDARSISFQGAGIASVGYSNGSVVVSVPAGGGGGDGVNIIAAGTQTANTTGTVSFANSNGISFGMSNSSVVTASYTVPSTAGLLSAINLSAGTTSSNASAFTFSNSNGISFGLNGATITGSHNALTTARASNDAVGLNTAQTNVTWTVNSSGISFNAGGYAGTSTGFTGANISGSMTHNSAGLALSLSVAAGGGGGAAISAGTQSTNGGTVVFSNSNGISFGMSNSSIITASYTVPTQSNQTMGMYALGNTTQNSSSTFDARTMSLNGLGAMTVGYSNGSVQLSAPATSSLVGVNGISISTNGSTISISNQQIQQSFFWGMPPIGSTSATQIGNGTIAVYPVLREGAFTASRADMWASFSVSSSSNSSHAGALSIYAGLYTRNGSTLSLASSGSQSYQWTNTSNNSLGSIASLRQLSMPFNINFTGGDLFIAVMTRSSTTNANWFTASNIIQSFGHHSGQVIGNIGEASNATRGILGLGMYSATSTALPGSIAFTQITGGFGGTASASRLMPNIYFANFTA